MRNDYNSIAGYYDRLSRLVFQRSIIKAQQYLIDFISDNNKVLLVGGGTGWVLDEISKLNRKNISVVYVEKSSKMIELSKKRKHKNVSVEFVHTGIESYKAEEHFDVIFTPFLFDNFIEKRIQYVFQKLDALLKQKGFWLYADFVNYEEVKKAWKQYFLKTMYVFFSLAANIETKKLIDMRPYFAEKYNMITQQFYYRRFIESIVYRKIK
ncbi:MAG TPA: class I SAM-dependent methyltransferase [Parafilimonas sp.]|nr:class I SAM-dependent methyltransferase [Parafilimonas sp.]